MSRRLFIATRNPHKVREIAAVLADLELELQSCNDVPGAPEVLEDGDTLEANAAKKARVLCAWTGLRTLADDSGLEVDALGGAPGVRSARWAGEACTFADNNRKLLRELASTPDEQRTARFRCVIAVATPATDAAFGDARALRVAADERVVDLFEGSLEGQITHAPRGAGGFGYDPLFFVPEEGCTLAEMAPPRKNAISHRARALAAVRLRLRVELGGRT